MDRFDFGNNYLDDYIFNNDDDSNNSWIPAYVPFCSRIQTYSVFNKILLWDLAIFVPNILFVIFLLMSWLRVQDKMRNINFPILSVFYNLILLASLLSITRCIVTTYIKPTNQIGVVINKFAWLIVRFGQLSTELSVVIFGLFFARLDSEKSIFRIMYLTIPISLLYTSIQGCLELLFPDKHYVVYVDDDHYFDLYGHGGMIFWFVSSTIFFLIYIAIFSLPFTRLKATFPIPTKKSFYAYCFLMAILEFIQLSGAAITYADFGTFGFGLCILDFTTFVSFTMFGPLVYIIFLKKFFQKETILSNRYLLNIDGSFDQSMNSHHDQLTRSINQSGNILITSNPRSSMFSNDHEQAHSSNINSYSSFRDEFSHRKILNNPFDFDESFEEENENNNDEEPTVIILSGGR